MSENETKIVRTMQNAGKPLILTHIADRAKIPFQLVDYHLEKMMAKGIVIKDGINGKMYYMLQPPFYDKAWKDAFKKLLLPLVEAINADENLILDLTEVPREKVVINVLTTLLKRFEEELQKEFK